MGVQQIHGSVALVITKFRCVRRVISVYYYALCLEQGEKVYLIIEHLIKIECIVGQPIVLEVSISVKKIWEHKILINNSVYSDEEA